MKTINEIVKEAGISRQTLYRVLSRAGLSLDDVTTERRGKTRLFDEEAEKTIVAALQQHCNNNSVVRDNVTTDNATTARQRADIERLQREAEELRKQLDDLKRERDQLTEERDKLKEDNSILIRTNATQAVTIQQMEQREAEKLTSGSASESERNTSAGWIRRTWARITGKGKREE